MNPRLGWTLLSRDALSRAERQLCGETEGVRDELGFLTLHQLYADRLFPGTSVLHTRLRYALFVPWMYEQALAQGATNGLAKKVQARELRLTGRLIKGREDGIIGSRVYPTPAVQSACMSYWGALGSWGILRGDPDGTIPSRAAIHHRARTAYPVRRQLDDDHEPFEEETAVFVNLPDRPTSWDADDLPLRFELEGNEGDFLRERWRTLRRADGQPALLARMVEQRLGVAGFSHPWAAGVRKITDRDDRSVLDRARQASALATIARSVYATQVETLRSEQDALLTPAIHSTEWPQIVQANRDEAAALDVAALRADLSESGMDVTIVPVLEATQEWLTSECPKVLDLLEPYRAAEISRKGLKSRLAPNRAARERRASWQADDTRATPLHYRWPQVQRLLADLHPARS